MRRATSLAVLLAGVAAVPTFGDVTGNVNGVAEQPHVTALEAIRALEQEAKAIALGVPEDQPLPEDKAAMVTDKINMALAQLAALKTAIQEGGPYQDTTLEADALKAIEKAQAADASCVKKVGEGKNAFSTVYYVDKAEREKNRAQLALMGLKTTPKDDKALAANFNAGHQTVVHDADVSGNKKDMKYTREDVERERASALDARARAMAKKYGDYKGLRSSLVSTAAFKPVPDYYYAFEGTSAKPGYIFKSFGRQLFGPFDVHFQVGSFKLGDTADTGSACIEFDVEGSDPLQFVAVCGRRIGGGVQVFVQSHNGPQGNLFLSSTTVAQVLVSYSGTQFVVKAASGQFAPDFVLSSVATVNLTQGETALVAGMGASGLTKGAEIGLDEIYIDAK